jgi:hypothetical protein
MARGFARLQPGYYDRGNPWQPNEADLPPDRFDWTVPRNPLSEDEMLQGFEQEHFGPKGGAFNPPMQDAPGDLDEEFRQRYRHLIMGTLLPSRRDNARG